MRAQLLLLIVVLCLVQVGGAADLTNPFTRTTVEDVTAYSAVTEEGEIFQSLIITVPAATQSIVVDSDTYRASINIVKNHWYSSDVSVEFYSKVTSNTSYYAGTWKDLGTPLAFFIGAEDGGTEGVMRGGVWWRGVLFDEVVYSPTRIAVTGTVPMEIYTATIAYENLNQSLPDWMLNVIAKIPYVGPYVAKGLELSGIILGSFFHYTWLFISNIVLWIMLFEVGVFLHAITIMRGGGARHKRITKSMGAIVDDNKIALELAFGIIMRGLELVYRVIQAVGNWIPFT